MKFRKKPVEIEAIQLTPDLFWECHDQQRAVFDRFSFSSQCHPPSRRIDFAYIFIETLEGKMRADMGDWIIKGVKGEFYPCKPDIFEATYELADSNYCRDGKGGFIRVNANNA